MSRIATRPLLTSRTPNAELDFVHGRYCIAIRSLDDRVKRLKREVSRDYEFTHEAQLLARDIINAANALRLIIAEGEGLPRND